MPPHVPRKRMRVSSPDETVNSSKKAKSNAGSSRSAGSRKASLYDALDATSTPQSSKNNFLDGIKEEKDESESSLSSLSDVDFEDVPSAKVEQPTPESDEEEDIEFEDVAVPKDTASDVPVVSGDLELTLNRDTRISLVNAYGDKKGPTKREKKVRIATHSLHVLLLLWHNAIRNSWICDEEVQATMISHLPPGLWAEVDRWRRQSGLEKQPPVKAPSTKLKGKRKSKGRTSKEGSSRDWGSASERLEDGKVDMSHGDPLFRLMQTLVSWWRQRFRASAPGLRKWGYMSLERLDRLTKAHKENPSDPERFGERLSSIEEFRECARNCRGSRDVESQLFTALLRGIGLEARMVANLQTLGFGWSKLEDAELEDEEGTSTENASSKNVSKKKPTKSKAATSKTGKSSSRSTTTRARSNKKNQADPIVIADSDELDLEYKDSDEESVVELEVRPKASKVPSKKYDSDLEYPHYWTEVLSPVTNTYLPVDPIVKNIIATNRDLVETLEPRGAKAEKARQVMAYIVGFSQDGTAKDVTVRYLKRQVLPGRTKGARMPLEKIPVYNRHGKVKRYDQYDWFKTAMAGYRRGSRQAPVTEPDELEDSTALRPAEPEKKQVKEGAETLQYYKQSKEFVLERHLKREEALRPDCKPVKVFKNKAKGGKIEEEDVFLRSDVLNVKSAETWHKQGRAPLPGEQPLKRVPYRVATINRRRELEEAEAMTGRKVLQGLFSKEQTDYIVPPPIKDGIIPKNEYGNIDLFVEHMCPEGAVHVPFREAIKVCKKIGIDYAEAVVGFEFGHRMAVPVIQGVVIAEENHEMLMEELEKHEVERQRKENEKRRKAALGKWRKFLMGLRIVERIRQDYGEIDESVSVFGHSKGGQPVKETQLEQDEDTAGGFLPEGYEEDVEDERSSHQASSFFPTAAQDEDGGEHDGLVMESHLEEEE
ncbi:unnamed protein product [Clonostachys rosea]|uniref:Rad4 beta-hairpin domain-containing protein n=1 Tax=Bionectria ochroleuca TaxID=29856 RepID=A0ABY6US21_BIOOC|nr:unnamed protein product [Clonostachys rosea]